MKYETGDVYKVIEAPSLRILPSEGYVMILSHVVGTSYHEYYRVAIFRHPDTFVGILVEDLTPEELEQFIENKVCLHEEQVRLGYAV